MARRIDEGLSNAADRAGSRIAVVYRAISELKLDPRNPRTHSPRQLRQIARSIEAFGFNVPVLVDGNDKVVAGHGRILACRFLGWIQVPTIRLDHLSEFQARAFMIADNRLTENSVWNEQLLSEQMKELSELVLDFSLEAIGFEMGEIDLRIESLKADRNDERDPADCFDNVPTGPPVCRPGDLFQLGRHRVLCGSALERTCYAALLGDKRAAAVFSDPPFNLQIEGNVSGHGAVHHRDFAMACGEMNQAEYTEFLAQACSLLAQYTVDGALHFICMDWRHMNELLVAGRRVYSELKNLCVWVKNHTGMGSLYRSRHELIFVFKHGRGSHRNNVQLGKYGRDRANVWQYPSPRTPTDEGKLLRLHPTVKPVGLVADAILDSTARGDIVLDGFLGSGSTLIAAERVGRSCVGLEIDPVYVDVIIRRWQSITGDGARHTVTGRPFSELEAERAEGLHDVQ